MNYQAFIGLEIHIHLLTKSKAFCSCPAHFGDEPNTNVCPVCMGYPGALPAANAEALLMSYRVAGELGCTLSRNTVFERKNYFYPDMPKNYQISQFAAPLGTGGCVEFEFSGTTRKVRLRECHMEEDAGKLIHQGDHTLIDYNRAGVPLLEIVSEPELTCGEEAEAYLQEFRRLVRYLGVCDGNMEEGSLRCDANVSVNEEGKGLGSKVEIKNINSFKFVRKALNFEIARQTRLLSEGGKVTQETRLWNENRDVTETMRKKESAKDYRYFPEPDLPPFRPDAAFLSAVEATRVEKPLERKRRFIGMGLTAEQASLLAEEKETADFFEMVIAAGAEPEKAAAWMTSDLHGQLNKRGLGLAASPMTPGRFARILCLLATGAVQSRIAKDLIAAILDGEGEPDAIVKARGWERIADPALLARFAREAVEAAPDAAAAVKAGDEKPLVFLVGRAMKASGGRADPVTLRAAILARVGVVGATAVTPEAVSASAGPAPRGAFIEGERR